MAESPIDGPQVVDLVKAEKPEMWMQHKYGAAVRPWTGTLKLSNTVSGKDGQYDAQHNEGSQWSYTYQLTNTHTSQGRAERLPMRTVEVHTPNDYKGYVGHD